MTQKIEKSKEILCFEVLYVLYGGLWMSKLQFLIQKMSPALVAKGRGYFRVRLRTLPPPATGLQDSEPPCLRCFGLLEEYFAM
jgi:hypothetical protein